MSDEQVQSIDEKLRQAWRQEQKYYHVRGASRFIIWLVALLLVDFLIDWGIVFRARLGVQTGTLLLIVNVVVLGWVLWHEWLRHLRAFDAVLVSLDVEAKHPELRSLLVSYSQIQRDAPNQADVSTELIDAMRDQAVIQSKPLDFREVIDFGQLKKLLIVTGCILLFFVGLSVNWGAHFGVLLQRLVGSGQGYPTQTTIERVAGDLTVKAGDGVTILAKVSGITPDEGRVYLKAAEGAGGWQAAPLTRRGGGGSYSRELTEISEDTKYYVRIGDDQSKEYNIRIVNAPEIESASVRLKYPNYMNDPDGSSDQLNLDNVPEGTEVEWTLNMKAAVSGLEVRLVGEDGDDGVKPEPIDVQRLNNGMQLKFSKKATDDFKYSFKWTREVDGQTFGYDDVQHYVRVSRDETPEIKLLKPGMDAIATVNKKVTLRAQADDDHGLKKAWLVYSVNGSNEERVEIRDFGGVETGQIKHVWTLSESIKNLEVGMRISYAIEVLDHHPDEIKHKNRSVTRQYTIVDRERYLQWWREELGGQGTEVERVRESELNSAEKVKELKNQESPAK